MKAFKIAFGDSESLFKMEKVLFLVTSKTLDKNELTNLVLQSAALPHQEIIGPGADFY